MIFPYGCDVAVLKCKLKEIPNNSTDMLKSLRFIQIYTFKFI